MGWRDDQREKRQRQQEQWQEEAHGGRGIPGSTDPDDYVIVSKRVTHVGGLAATESGQIGQLRVNVYGATFSNNCDAEAIPWGEVTGVLADDREEAKSRVAAVVAFGVLGLGAKGSQTVTEIAFHLTAGRIVAFATVDETASAVRTRLAPTLASVGLQIDRPPSGAPSNPGGSFVDELERLAALYERGILSEEELAAAKQKLLG